MSRRILFLPLVFLLSTCTHDKAPVIMNYQTENVIVIVIDGPRYSETWGEPSRANIPFRDSLLAEGILLTNFRNNGTTVTNPGNDAICTGNYEYIANDGSQYPSHPSFMQQWIKTKGASASECCLITSKDKLHVLSNTTYPDYNNNYIPYFDCGVNGNGTGGYRTDAVTYTHVIEALNTKQPRILVTSFKDPDSYGHAGDSLNYIQAIRTSDQYVGQIWAYIQSNPHYKNKTTLIVTNDHGRHLDGIADGFVSHGDDCEGCRHIELFALSPDFKKNAEISTAYEQIDISATICELLHIPFETGNGKVMRELFK